MPFGTLLPLLCRASGVERTEGDELSQKGPVKAKNRAALIFKPGHLVKDPERLKAMSRRVSDISHTDAARLVVEGVRRGLEEKDK